jgi:hypothetical protein
MFLLVFACLLASSYLGQNTRADGQEAQDTPNSAAIADISQPTSHEGYRLTSASSKIVSSLAVSNVTITSFPIEGPTYTAGQIDGQDGWSAFGGAGHGCVQPGYDHVFAARTDVPNAPTDFGNLFLRVSNAYASGCFGDQTFTKSSPHEAGETDASNTNSGGTHYSSGVRQANFTAEFDFASADPNNYQPNLSVVVSPDRGDGARMSWIQFFDTSAGIEINFYDYRHNLLDFHFKHITTLNRHSSYRINISMNFFDGAYDVNGSDNDQVRVRIYNVSGSLIAEYVGRSWENYFRDFQNDETFGSRTVDSLLFRTSVAAPDTLGKGFLFDNFNIKVGPIDADNDTVSDDIDEYLNSAPIGVFVVVNSHTTSVKNKLDGLTLGQTIADGIAQCGSDKNCLAGYFLLLKRRGTITTAQYNEFVAALQNSGGPR